MNILSDALPPTVGNFQHPQRVAFGQLGMDVSVTLPHGTTLYWSVRTLDGGTSRSVASAENTLVVADPSQQGSLSSAPVSGVFVTSLTVNWGSTFPGGTQYTAQLATAADFS
ncbi:MAG: hypothetical protein HYV15_02485, partial [Elusimicrobia bacterium]|nr:hypothetical protein [Elusimicrobiota bacterium]